MEGDVRSMIEVVIAVHNRRAITLRCLELLAQQVGVTFRTTVVDDGSSDGTSEAIRARFPQVDVLRGDGSLWWAGATNLGIQHALNRDTPAPYLLLLNDDVEFDSDYLACMERCAMTHPDCLIGSLAVYGEDPERVFWGGQAAPYREYRFGYVRRDCTSGCVPAQELPGRGMLVPRDVFDRIGLLDAQAFPQYSADTDFSWRARKAGYRLLCCWDTAVVATASQTGPGSPLRRGQDPLYVFLSSFWNARSPNYLPPMWRFCRKHRGILAPWRFALSLTRIMGREFLQRTGLINLMLPRNRQIT